jgi:hypothetical protein
MYMLRIPTRLCLVLIALFLHTLSGTAAATKLTPQQQQWLSRASRHEQDGWITLHIEGSPQEMGFQHGYLLAKEIDTSLITTRKVWEYDSGMEWPWLVENGNALFSSRFDSSLLTEMEGIVEGLSAAGVKSTLAEIITYNGYIELSGYW